MLRWATKSIAALPQGGMPANCPKTALRLATRTTREVNMVVVAFMISNRGIKFKLEV